MYKRQSEQKEMIIRSVRNAIETTKFLPMEMVRDSGKPFDSKEYKYIENYMRFLGCYCRKHIPGHPQDKGHVERFFGTLQTTVLKNIKGYIGEGVKSTKDSSRPDADVVLESRKHKNLRSKEELEQVIKESIEFYNSNKIHEDISAPNARFNFAKTDKNITPITKHNYALLFWKQTRVKVKQSMIILTEGARSQNKHQYIIYDESLRLSLNLTEVSVCYQKEDRSIIKIFDENDNWITDLTKKDPIPMVYKRKPSFTIRPQREDEVLNKNKADPKIGAKFKPKAENQLYKRRATNKIIKK